MHLQEGESTKEEMGYFFQALFFLCGRVSPMGGLCHSYSHPFQITTDGLAILHLEMVIIPSSP